MSKRQQMMLLISAFCCLIHATRATCTGKLDLENPRDTCSYGGLKPRDCEDIQRFSVCSGVYTIFLGPQDEPVEVYCSMTSGSKAWTVLQRRESGNEDFYRGWTSYERGFGNRQGEYWIGNHALHLLTSQGNYLLRIDLEDFEGEKKYAEYSVFKVASAEDKYRISISGYKGNAKDGMALCNKMKFSTWDSDNDGYTGNCAMQFRGAWWYNSCHDSNLNALYLRGATTSYAMGVGWEFWRGHYYSLKFTEMKVHLA